MLLLLAAAALLVTGISSTAPAHDSKATRFVCTSIPLDADPTCPVPPAAAQVNTPQEQDLRATVMHLRETILQQKETMGNQKETIKELTSKLTRCEGAQLETKYKGNRRKPSDKPNGKDTMGDLPRDHSEVVDHLGRAIQALKDRLGSLEVRPTTSSPQQQTRPDLSNHAFPSDLREQLQRKLGDLESQLLNKVSELEDDKYILLNETAAHRYKTESALNALHERVTELEKESSGFKSPDDFKVALPLRTNYLFARIKKSLPEMYAFTVCMWIRSRASSGIGTPFSYAVSGQTNEIVLIEWGKNPIELLINDKVAQLPMNINDGKWHHICITWTTRDGMWEAYQDGQLLGRGENLAPWHPIKAGGDLILGQEQDTVGGRFDATQAFVGELSHFNIWDRILTSDVIRSIANCSANLAGNVIPWIENNVIVNGGATKLPLETCQERLVSS
ncbi:neuronal pentraxin-2b isoform X1 [Scyliorhinus canicula]|uniref:neuronal pentraxin-2b isoform X1 n=1 Tax=Scyliorhinus canicula TaxID=7830 RepID=UPI0018F589C1|nr:neuronal pentraxin-2b isoform X1 [Scyliorhinus canicula]